MTNPILSRQKLKRLPFRRRPVADPGTALVFQRSNGELVAPTHAYTTGEIWWRGPLAVYVVDTSPHAASFACTLPCAGDALHFEAHVHLTWSVHRPEKAVDTQVSDPAADCRGHLIKAMRIITRRFTPLDSGQAERAIHAELAQIPLDLANGLRISGLAVALRLDPDQAVVAKELEIAELRQELAEAQARGQVSIDKITQDGDLARRGERAAYYTALFAKGNLGIAGSMLAQDPDKVREAADFMVSVEQRDHELALRAMKVLVDSDQLRIGELDPAVAAVVERFTALVSELGGKVAGGRLGNGSGAAPLAAGYLGDQVAAIEESPDERRDQAPEAGPERVEPDGQEGERA